MNGQRGASLHGPSTQRGEKRIVMAPSNTERASSPAAFDYSAAEWAEIKASIEAMTKLPLQESDLDRVRRALLRVARRYLSEIAEPLTPTQRKRLAARSWRRVAHASEKLHVLLSACAEQRLGELAEGQYLHSWERKKFDRLVNALVDLRVEANNWAVHYDERTEEDLPGILLARDMNNPRVVFQFEILNTWAKCGGKLRISRHPINGAIRGPLARYFAAVTRPVMGSRAPSLQSLPSIVARQKEMNDRLRR